VLDEFQYHLDCLEHGIITPLCNEASPVSVPSPFWYVDHQSNTDDPRAMTPSLFYRCGSAFGSGLS
jgi:hypothetical protein